MMDGGSESFNNNRLSQFSPKTSSSDNDVDEKISCLNVFYLIVFPNE